MKYIRRLTCVHNMDVESIVNARQKREKTLRRIRQFRGIGR